MRTRGVLIAVLAAGTALSAQQFAVASGQPVFRTGVELVTIDVVATTRDGNPIHNLKAEDFELFEDGVRQDIRTFEFINFSSPPPLPLLPPGIATNAMEPGGIFAVVLDEIGVQADDVQTVRRAAQRFFQETLQPNDHVAVVRSGVNSGFFLTNDRTMALDAVARSTGRRERTLGLEAPGGAEPAIQESPATIETFGTAEDGRNSFRVLASVVDRLSVIPARRKAILWFSRGGDMPQNYTESLELGRPVGRDDDVFSRLIQRARAGNVAIYTVDPRGLQAPGADTSRDLNPFDVGALRDLAALTGGRSVLTNDINGELEKVATENRAYYLLGYEPAPGTSKRPRPRKLRVTTRAPGVSLLHRSVFVPGESKAAAPELLASPLPVRDLPIALAPAAVAIDRRKRGLVVPFEIGGDLRDGTDVQYSAMALDPAGRVVSRAQGRGKASNGRVVGEVGLTTESNAYQVRFAARALNPDVNGLAFATMRVPEGNSKEAECGGFVFEQPGPRDGLRVFTRNAPVTISTLVSAAGLNDTVAPLNFALGPAGGVPQKTWPVQLGMPLANGLWRVALTLRAPLPAGNLEIQLLNNGLLLHDNCLAQFLTR
jgi:VWFA-related protein